MSSMISSKVPIWKSRYRPAVPVSAEISKHCHIYLDEGLYISALTLLTDLVAPGAAHPSGSSTPAFAPLPFHIEIVSILLIHPKYTSQAPRNEQVELASRSITFLRSLLNIIGPVNANLDEAFSLIPSIPKSGRRSRYSGEENGSESEDDEMEHVRGVVANQGRLRRCAKDFWHIVGWALNCSVIHPHRWKYWKVWLDYMLDVMDADWNEREAQDKEDEAFQAKLQNDPKAQCDFTKLRSSIVVKYMSDVKGRSAAVRRVVGSAFTDGGTDDLRSYPEVFQNETQTIRVQQGQKRKWNDEVAPLIGGFGENDADDQTLGLSHFTDAPSEPSRSPDNEEAPDPWMGGPESIILRQRVLALLSRTAAVLPDCFTNLKDLYDLYCDNLKQVPLPAFSLLLSPSYSSPLPVVAFVSLTQLLQLRLLPNTVPRPQSFSNRKGDELTQDILERCFLPFAASTCSIEDNAKVSILAENILRVYMKTVRCYHTPTLDAAIETGVLAREAKIKSDKRRRVKSASKEEEQDRVWLVASGKRLRSLLTWVEENPSDGDD